MFRHGGFIRLFINIINNCVLLRSCTLQKTKKVVNIFFLETTCNKIMKQSYWNKVIKENHKKSIFQHFDCRINKLPTIYRILH